MMNVSNIQWVDTFHWIKYSLFKSEHKKIWRQRCKNAVVVVMVTAHSVLHSRNILPIVTSHAFNSAPPAAMLCGCVTFSYCVLTPRRGQYSIQQLHLFWVSSQLLWWHVRVWRPLLNSQASQYPCLMLTHEKRSAWYEPGWWQCRWRYHQSRVLPTVTGNTGTLLHWYIGHTHRQCCNFSTAQP